MDQFSQSQYSGQSLPFYREFYQESQPSGQSEPHHQISPKPRQLSPQPGRPPTKGSNQKGFQQRKPARFKWPEFESSKNLKPKTFEKGHEIFAADRVSGLKAIFPDIYLCAVSDDKGEKFQTLVSLGKDWAEDLRCQCSRSYATCEHIVAALLAVQAKLASTSGRSQLVNHLPLDDLTSKRFNDRTPDKAEGSESSAFSAALECFVCRQLMDTPVVLPCLTHMVCYQCMFQLYESKEPVLIDGQDVRRLYCPLCGANRGSFDWKSKPGSVWRPKFTINKTMQKVIEAHYEDKENWRTPKINDLSHGSNDSEGTILQKFHHEGEKLMKKGGDVRGALRELLNKDSSQDADMLVLKKGGDK